MNAEKATNMRCIECGASLEVTDEPMDVEFRGEKLAIHGIEHYKCGECGEDMLSSKMNEAYNRAVEQGYRMRHGTITVR